MKSFCNRFVTSEMLSEPDVRVLAIVPVRNRKETTLRFLTSLQAQKIPSYVKVELLVIDDGSTDGTSEALRKSFPKATIFDGDGSLYWSGAIQRGLKAFWHSEYNFVWLLNDDIILYPNCFLELLRLARRFPGRVYSATVVNQEGDIIYGGIKRLPGFRFRKIGEKDYFNGIAFSETLNGNCALLSKAALSGFSWPRGGTYVHDGFDMFIGLEATRIGRGPVISRQAICEGQSNSTKLWYYSREKPIRERMKGVLSRKGVYPPMRWDLCRRFSGALAPLYFVKPYLRAFVGR